MSQQMPGGPSPAGQPRARDLGIPCQGEPGRWNAITDVPGVEVGYATLIAGDGPLSDSGASDGGASDSAASDGGGPGQLPSLEFIPWGLMDALYEAVVQCAEESVLNALVAARTMTGRDGHRSPGFPVGRLPQLLAG